MIIRNVVVKWASVHEPNTRFKPRWEVNIYPDEETCAMLEQEYKLELKTEKDTGEKFYKCTRSVTTAKGKELTPPKVVGRDPKVPFTENIGNGSICNVMVTIREVDAFGQKKMKAYLDGIQVMEHVPYGETFEDETDGSEEEF